MVTWHLKWTTGEERGEDPFLSCSDHWFYIAVSQGCGAAERSGHPEDVGARSQDETFADFHSHLHSVRQLWQRPDRGGRLPSPRRLLQTHRLFGVCSDFLSYFSDLHRGSAQYWQHIRAALWLNPHSYSNASKSSEKGFSTVNWH